MTSLFAIIIALSIGANPFILEEQLLYDLVTIDHQDENLDEELYYDSLELLACCVEAEAGNQEKYGKALVVDVILNRVDDEDFPNTIEEVITQKNQFSVVNNGSIYCTVPSEETYEVVREEIDSRTNYDVMFFGANGFSDYGQDWQKVQDHYFSTKK